MSRVMGRATCRGTRTHGVGEVVDDKRPTSHATSRVTSRGSRSRGVGEVVDDKR
jgi:hypothetical protein